MSEAFIIEHPSLDKPRAFFGETREERAWAYIRAATRRTSDAEWERLKEGETLEDGTSLDEWVVGGETVDLKKAKKRAGVKIPATPPPKVEENKIEKWTILIGFWLLVALLLGIIAEGFSRGGA